VDVARLVLQAAISYVDHEACALGEQRQRMMDAVEGPVEVGVGDLTPLLGVTWSIGLRR